MQRLPHFHTYVMAKLLTIVVVLLLMYVLGFSLFFSFSSYETLTIWEAFYLSLTFLSLGVVVLVVFIYRGASRLQKELVRINKNLENMGSVKEVTYKGNFSTQEFVRMQENLNDALRSAQKKAVIKQRYNAKLKLKNRQRADMLSAIAHEFRNPIASIVGYAQTLKEDREIPVVLREKFLDKIYTNGYTLEGLLSRLLLWNKFESKETTLDRSRFDLLVLVDGVKQQLEEVYPTREIKVVGVSCIIVADRTLLEIVIKNLLENAFKYSTEVVEVYLEEGRVSVVDRGIGIKKGEIEKVTKKFYRSDTQSWDSSMGLGLAIVKTILSLHGMELEIESVEGKGSTFSFGCEIF